MENSHKILYADARNMQQIPDNHVELIITSPPYPMIAMWDSMFSQQNPEIQKALDENKGQIAFELMNQELDKAWKEAYRVLKDGGIACINIGDATKTLDGNFQLYPTHTRIVDFCRKIGFQILPEILWRKPTNSPNKFMGSGMLPPGAYVTLEHEHILILRKGAKRELSAPVEKQARNESAFFWEERNSWFSDVWTGLNGIHQATNSKQTRERSAAYPFDLAYRLINMFSVKGDIVLDPYLGTGTTTLAAMSSERNSIGIEIDAGFKPIITSRLINFKTEANEYINNRLKKHIDFLKERASQKGLPECINNKHGFPVISKQEANIALRHLQNIEINDEDCYKVKYADLATAIECIR